MSELIPYSQHSSEVAPTGVGALVERKADRLARKQVAQSVSRPCRRWPWCRSWKDSSVWHALWRCPGCRALQT